MRRVSPPTYLSFPSLGLGKIFPPKLHMNLTFPASGLSQAISCRLSLEFSTGLSPLSEGTVLRCTKFVGFIAHFSCKPALETSQRFTESNLLRPRILVGS
uniref:Uncharacterized protein n=1 Tax=Arundo donax TaxID=35708 RepID=A0A0A9BAV4_ARUDO